MAFHGWRKGRKGMMKKAGAACKASMEEKMEAALNKDERNDGIFQVPYSAGTQAPRLQAPADACDSHMHVYDNRYPAAPEAALTPPDASVDQYLLLQTRIGTTRTVIVNPSTYGTNNTCMLAALARFGSTARGIAVVHPDISDVELARLNQMGVRGIRFNFARSGAATAVDMIEPLAHRIHELGWHLQLLMPPDQLLQLGTLLQRLPTPIVFDHLGRLPAAKGTAHPAFAVLLDLLDRGRAWVKLSGAYLITQRGAPYRDVTNLGKALVNAAPERMVWGSDWPHVVASAGEKPMPDDAMLLDLLLDWAPAADLQKKILVDNPACLYGF